MALVRVALAKAALAKAALGNPDKAKPGRVPTRADSPAPTADRLKPNREEPKACAFGSFAF